MQWNGSWEKLEGRVLCRWMIVWNKVGDRYFGCIGGYSGGGSFQLEKYVLHDGNCYLDSDIEWSALVKSEKEGDLVESSMDQILSFHDENSWVDSENLILCDTSIIASIGSENAALGTVLPIDLKIVFEKSGITSMPQF